MCEVSFDDYCSIWRESAVFARKPHRCDCCNTAIEPGTPYLKHFDVFDGYAHSASLCFVCWLIRAEFDEEHDVTLNPDGILHYLDECIAEGDEGRRWRPHVFVIRRRLERSTAEER